MTTSGDSHTLAKATTTATSIITHNYNTTIVQQALGNILVERLLDINTSQTCMDRLDQWDILLSQSVETLQMVLYQVEAWDEAGTSVEWEDIAAIIGTSSGGGNDSKK